MKYLIERPFGTMGAAFVRYGLGYGAVAAMIISYNANHSIPWMIIDGWLSWIYVIYVALLKL